MPFLNSLKARQRTLAGLAVAFCCGCDLFGLGGGLKLEHGPNASDTVGTRLYPPLEVVLQDSHGKPISGATVYF
ncbi:MAG TPA: hypothetical protein VG454_15140, partial [Gemmatimonadales bacterium]|nr:hypothetical protein [Gemmatimonadales bacterium]